ncbi:MAG: molecular chaperone Hsp33 [Treponema sp.]|nr:MAG: molecular chaperone Hsp33 [Treponema sp.]
MIDAKITDEKLLTHLNSLKNNGMTIFTLAENTIRGAIFDATLFVNKMRVQHNLGILETYILGQAGICTALLIPTMKGHDRTVFRYDTKGPVAGFSLEAFSEGRVRGYLFKNPIQIEKPLESWDVSPFLGDGIVSVVRFPEGARVPTTGTTEIIHKNIPLDLAEYFLKSEQTKTAFHASIKFDTEGRVLGAGGMYLQAMPDASLEDLQISEQAFSACPSLGEWYSEGGDNEDIAVGLFRQLKPKLLLTRDVIFHCPCSYEKFLGHLKSFSTDELNNICKTNPDPVEVYCHNCSSTYEYSKNTIQKIINSTNQE